MEITLSPSMRKFIEQKLKNGEYSSPNEIIESALASLQHQERLTAVDVKALRQELQVGIDQLERGESAPWDAEAIKQRVRRTVRRSKS